jgi:hypothetical protein
MLKYLFIILNSLALFLYSALRDDLDIITGFPSKVNAGETFNAEVTIFKGSLRKFGKLELIFPAGFTVEVTDPKAADFNFIGNKATFLWSYLPAEEEFTVSFKVTSNNTVSGKKIVKSNFYYVENNLKEVLEIDPVEIRVKNEGVAEQDDPTPSAKGETNKKATEIKDTTLKSIDSIANLSSKTVLDTSKSATVSASNEATVSDIRSISASSTKDEFKITHNINKGDLSGFGKIEDIIPEGYAAANDKSSGASYTFNNNKVRYVWVNLPPEKNIEVVYFIRRTGTSINNSISGSFDYLKNNETKSLNIGETLIPKIDNDISNANTKVEPVVVKEKAKPTEGALTGYRPNAKKTPPKKATPATLNTQSLDDKPKEQLARTDEFNTAIKDTNNKVENTVAKSSESAENQTATANLSNKAKINFSVQVAALQKQKEAVSIQKYLALSDKLQIEYHDGYSKYVSGKFDEYMKAKTHRDKIRNNGKRRAFVTAYNTGKRITVQEALMIANQQWYK